MAAKTRKSIKPGDSYSAGVVVKLSDEGAYLGRYADEGERCPARHSEHVFDGRRVILSDDQGPFPLDGLK